MPRREYRVPREVKQLRRARGDAWAAVKRAGRPWRVCKWMGPAWFAQDVEVRIKFASRAQAELYVRNKMGDIWGQDISPPNH